MTISKNLLKSVRENFPGIENTKIRKEIKKLISLDISPIFLKHKIAFSSVGIESLKAVQKVFREETQSSMADVIEHVYTVRDASGEYLASNGKRTPASNAAMEYETREEAQAACDRATDKVCIQEIE